MSKTFKFDYLDMISRNRGLSLMTPIKLLVESLGFRLRSSMVRIIYVFARYVHQLYVHQGTSGVVILLKAQHVHLMQVLAGYTPVEPPHKVRFSTCGDGLPRCIPLVHRKRIRSGDVLIIRL